ncbi:MAG: hypothetical protein IKT01_04765 [Eubacteriaceae bacterium]|nr:hypothetical protein [Eubacteriaceae bacterium]
MADLSLYRAEYNKGGGMDGGHEEIILEVRENGSCIIKAEKQDYWGARIKRKRIRLSRRKPVREEILNALDGSKYMGWNDLEYSDEIALDAPVSRLSVYFTGEKNESYSISNNLEMDKNDRQAMYGIISILRRYAFGE